MPAHPGSDESCSTGPPPKLHAEATSTHHLVLPRDANHHGTFYAGAILSLALEAGYAAAYRSAGAGGNLVLKRVLDLRCYYPVPVGQVVEVQGLCVWGTQTQLVIALFGLPILERTGPWCDSLMQFVQVDHFGRPEVLPEASRLSIVRENVLEEPWRTLRDRATRLLALRR
jgi:acyl-CoA thioesterase YciA